eukprot:TRINITY_DN11838_c2_g1_i1.p1 TRINITY_DN11838_c2_g1~~TRINITY_DN11838_c2_g1_i1.p1  ORF type:complete len:763 (-),score=248.08 TRINITY_DN11838_c2_g1_i1:104-2335(-)
MATDEKKGAARLEDVDLKILDKAADVIRTTPKLVLEEEFAFFKELVVSWGGTLDPLPEPQDGGASKAVASNAKPQDKDESPAKPAAPVDLLLDDSDEEMEVSGAVAEMLLPLNLLHNEFADDPADKTFDDGAQDPEQLAKDEGPYPPLPPRNFEPPSDARKKVLAKVKQEASELQNLGQEEKALERYTELIRTGGATALILTARASVLLQLKRPCAAIRDCCAALHLNPDCGKAFHVRGTAHRRLGHWKKAYRDLSQGQKLDFSDESVSIFGFVTKRVDVTKETQASSGSGFSEEERAKKVHELLGKAEAAKPAKAAPAKPQIAPPSKQLKVGQAIRLGGLQKAPHLNGKRGLVQRLNPGGNDRWDIEVRMERGRLETKAIKSENIMLVRATDGPEWQMEEAKHAEERKKREKEEKKWKEEEDRRKFVQKQSGTAKVDNDGFPTMDPSEKLEAEMSSLPLDNQALRLLRRLRPQVALEILQQVSLQGISSNLSSYIRIKVRQMLGEPDSDEEKPPPKPVYPRAATTPTPKAAQPPPPPPPVMTPPTMAPPVMTPPAAAPPPAQEPEESDEDSEDEDFDLLPEEKEAVLATGFNAPEPSDKQMEDFAKWKQEAEEALESGDQTTALDRYTSVISGGGASALMLAKRGDLLLKLNRPCAAIKDATAAIQANPDVAKAFRIRGIAYRKLGKYAEAKQDLVEAQRLDFDEGISAVAKFVTEKVRIAAKKRRKAGGDGGPDAKRAKGS